MPRSTIIKDGRQGACKSRHVRLANYLLNALTCNAGEFSRPNSDMRYAAGKSTSVHKEAVYHG